MCFTIYYYFIILLRSEYSLTTSSFLPLSNCFVFVCGLIELTTLSLFLLFWSTFFLTILFVYLILLFCSFFERHIWFVFFKLYSMYICILCILVLDVFFKFQYTIKDLTCQLNFQTVILHALIIFIMWLKIRLSICIFLYKEKYRYYCMTTCRW